MDVTSFTIDHDKLLPGVYVSRKDTVGGAILTTFDLRMKRPNAEPVIDNPAIHTLEHLMAVYLRGSMSGYADKTVYIGPMGCRTGMYLILNGDFQPSDIVPMLIELFEFIAGFDEAVPATTSKECGNYLDHNLAMAKWEAHQYLNILRNACEECMVYPA